MQEIQCESGSEKEDVDALGCKQLPLELPDTTSLPQSYKLRNADCISARGPQCASPVHDVWQGGASTRVPDQHEVQEAGCSRTSFQSSQLLWRQKRMRVQDFQGHRSLISLIKENRSCFAHMTLRLKKLIQETSITWIKPVDQASARGTETFFRHCSMSLCCVWQSLHMMSSRCSIVDGQTLHLAFVVRMLTLILYVQAYRE